MEQYSSIPDSELTYGADCPYIDLQYEKGRIFFSNAVFRYRKARRCPDTLESDKTLACNQTDHDRGSGRVSSDWDNVCEIRLLVHR